MKNKHEILNKQANIAQLILDKLKECGYPQPNSTRSPLEEELIGEEDEFLLTEISKDFILSWDNCRGCGAVILIEEDGNILVTSVKLGEASWIREYADTDDFFKEFDDFGEQLRKGEQ